MPIEREIGATLYDFSDGHATHLSMRVKLRKKMQEIGITISSHAKRSCLAPTSFGCGSGRRDKGSKQALEEHFGQISKLFCYPYGRWDLKTEQLVIEAGFSGALTTEIKKLQRSGYAPFSFAPL